MRKLIIIWVINHTNRGDYERAITAYEKAIELNPEYSEFYNNLGITYQESGDIEKAISIFLRGLKLNDSDYELISKGLSIIIKHQQWNYLDQFITNGMEINLFINTGENLFMSD